MNKGTNRVTVRMPDELRSEIQDSIERKITLPPSGGTWTLTEWIIQACVDKLNHERRGGRKEERVSQLVFQPDRPREVTIE